MDPSRRVNDPAAGATAWASTFSGCSSQNSFIAYIDIQEDNIALGNIWIILMTFTVIGVIIIDN